MVRSGSRDVLVCSQPDPALGDFVQSRPFAETDELQSATLPVRLPVARLFAGAPDTTL
jgi:hypothetical protein